MTQTPPAADGGLPGPTPWSVRWTNNVQDEASVLDANGWWMFCLDESKVAAFVAWINAQAAIIAEKDAELAEHFKTAWEVAQQRDALARELEASQSQLAAATTRLASAEVVAMVGGKDKTKIRNATPEPFRDLLISIAKTSEETMTHPNDADPALKPCPFCGGQAELASGGPGNHYVRCIDCRAGGDNGAQERAIEWWNRRTTGPALKPSDEARRLVEAFATQSAYLWSDAPHHAGKGDLIQINRAEAALLAYIARLEASMPIDQAAALVSEIARLKRALEATPQNAGEAKPVGYIEPLDVEVLQRPNTSSVATLIAKASEGDHSHRTVALYLAAPPHADLVAENARPTPPAATSELVALLREVAECFKDAPDTTYYPRILQAATALQSGVSEAGKGEAEQRAFKAGYAYAYDDAKTDWLDAFIQWERTRSDAGEAGE